MLKIATIAFIILFFTTGKIISQVPDFCLTKEESRLITLINDYRAEKGLGIIPVSKSLCYVSKVHARDLFINNPDTSSCTLNSWSDKGLWAACCHSKYTPNPACILNKPKELTTYSGEGHEIAYWDSEELNADTVLRFWKSIEPARAVLLNQNKWDAFTWNAIGVGLYKGYACLWVGEVRDTLPDPIQCEGTPGDDKLVLPLKDMPKEIVTSPTGRYYIIFGSFNSVEDAVKMVDKYKQEGFYQAKILISADTFRVSLADQPTQQEALNAKKTFGANYKEAWVMKY